MKDNKDEKIKKTVEKIKKLPEKAQVACIWAIEHCDMIEEMCRDSKMTMEEIEKYEIIARKRKDYFLLIFLQAVRVYGNNSDKNKAEK